MRQLARDVTANLRAKGFPLSHSVYGPGRFPEVQTYGGSTGLALVFSRDRDGGDVVRDARGSQRNPRKLFTFGLGGVAHVFAKSPLDGARPEEHEDLCDQCVAQLLVELSKWCTAARAGVLVVSESRYLRPEETSGAEIENGVWYVLRFQIDRGVFDQNFDGTALTQSGFARVERANIGGRITIDGTNYEEIPDADSP